MNEKGNENEERVMQERSRNKIKYKREGITENETKRELR
jgi:hypothetical protein